MSDLNTAVFGAQHAEIAELLTDTPSGATYATPFDVPGLKSVSVSTSSDSKELRGDNQLLAKETVIQNVEVTLEFAKWDARILALITGAALSVGLDGESYSVTQNVDSTPKEFKLVAQSVSASGTGTMVTVTFPKLKITNLPDMIGLAEEDFKTVTVTCEAIPTAQGVWFDYEYTVPAV